MWVTSQLRKWYNPKERSTITRILDQNYNLLPIIHHLNLHQTRLNKAINALKTRLNLTQIILHKYLIISSHAEIFLPWTPLHAFHLICINYLTEKFRSKELAFIWKGNRLLLICLISLLQCDWTDFVIENVIFIERVPPLLWIQGWPKNMWHATNLEE